ncbi:hypothetical protein PtA15_8A778 [Puccinia triticina]|uniref:SAM domain-containing protein n=1 Tax=Puccinia triticina TaxID=208348 RepID=A0ABY7CRI0_9BASI|nr:uncharacterized protein PtA15_8A778 [Puccinia triticina]WAQ87871.1 hypothetical protein PtA15_8A778 [Puccinia triticina]
MPNNFEDNYDMLQDHDDFMLPSLSQINQWLADNIQQRGSPISIIQTSEQSNLPPSTTQDQQLGKEDTDLAQDGKHSQQVDDKKIKINVEYKFFFIIPEDKPTNPRQKKRKASNNDKKCKPLPSTPGLVHFNWDANVKNLGAFKKAAIKAIGLLDDEEMAADVMEHATEQEDDGEIIWSATIPHGGCFANKNKATLTDNNDLSDFLDKCKGPCKERRFTITMIQKDPKLLAQVAAMMGWTTGPWAWQGGPQANIAGLMNLTEIGTPPNAVRSPNIAQLAASTQEQQTVPLSTVPSNDNLKLNDFFQLAHVEPNQNLLDGLEELGIAHYSHFHSSSAKDLKDAGVKMGHARILMDNLKKYKQYIKSHHNGNHA